MPEKGKQEARGTIPIITDGYEDTPMSSLLEAIDAFVEEAASGLPAFSHVIQNVLLDLTDVEDE